MDLMKAEVQLLAHLQICDVFFVELKAEGMRRNVLFSLLLEVRPNPLTDGASTIYKATAYTHSSHINLLFWFQVSKKKQICLTPGVTDQVTVRISVFHVYM